MSSGVGEDLIRNVFVLLQEHLQLRYTDPQVAVGKVVRDVKPEGTVLPALNNDGVEQTQRLEIASNIRTETLTTQNVHVYVI